MAQDVGIKISKPYYDATDAGDADLIFSSSWPSIAVAQTYTFTVDSSMVQNNTLTIKHGLGYPPPAFGWKFISPETQKLVFGYADTLVTDSQNVYLSLQQTVPLPTKVHIKVYAIDLSTDVEYELAHPSAVKTTYDPNYGIRISQDGKDINSKDMRDFILHSRCQSPLVLAVKTEKSADASNNIIYNDPQGYQSWVFGYVRGSDGKYKPAPYYAQAYPITYINGTQYKIQWATGAGDNGGTLLVLRDPMFAGTDVNYSY